MDEFDDDLEAACEEADRLIMEEEGDDELIILEPVEEPVDARVNDGVSSQSIDTGIITEQMAATILAEPPKTP